jgi:hypothetical protein
MRPHVGITCPVAPHTLVAYRVVGGEGEVYTDRAGDLHWGDGLGEENLGRIIEWQPVVQEGPSA